MDFTYPAANSTGGIAEQDGADFYAAATGALITRIEAPFLARVNPNNPGDHWYSLVAAVEARKQFLQEYPGYTFRGREQRMNELTKAERVAMARETIEAMRAAYEAEGEEGDFADGERYLRDDASDEELRDEFKKWTNKRS
jgi:hypothetical protein